MNGGENFCGQDDSRLSRWGSASARFVLTATILLHGIFPTAESHGQSMHGWLEAGGVVPEYSQSDKLDPRMWWEVKVSRLGLAVSELENEPFRLLSEVEAASFADRYVAEPGKRAYLVRGMYSNYTGAFSLYWSDRILIVSHGSLGATGNPEPCPLVVNLPEAPKGIILYVSGAR